MIFPFVRLVPDNSVDDEKGTTYEDYFKEQRTVKNGGTMSKD